MLLLPLGTILIEKAVLYLCLNVRRKSVRYRRVNLVGIASPCRSVVLGNRRKKLLIPSHRRKELWSKFILRLDVIGERVGISNRGNLKPCLITFRPDLQMMPGKTRILGNRDLAIIIQPLPQRDRVLGRRL